MLLATRVHAHGFYPAAEYEADRRERIVKLVNDRCSIVVGNGREAGDFTNCSVADTIKVLMCFEQINNFVDRSA